MTGTDQAGEHDPRHPMRYVTRQTGLTAARLRMWERRYGVTSPGRSPGGQRLYSDEDVARLVLIARAVEAGHALPRLARLSHEELVALVGPGRPAATPGGEAPADPAHLLRCVERLDDRALEAELRRQAVGSGALSFCERTLTPFFRSIGDRWHRGDLSPAHEHMASSVAMQVLGWLTAQYPAAEGAPCLVVATPVGEQHELGAAMAAAVGAEQGWRVVYLGRDLPAGDIALAARSARASAVALSVVNAGERERTQREVEELLRAVPANVRVAVGGAGAAGRGLERAGRVTLCPDLPALQAFLAERPRATPG